MNSICGLGAATLQRGLSAIAELLVKKVIISLTLLLRVRGMGALYIISANNSAQLVLTVCYQLA